MKKMGWFFCIFLSISASADFKCEGLFTGKVTNLDSLEGQYASEELYSFELLSKTHEYPADPTGQVTIAQAHLIRRGNAMIWLSSLQTLGFDKQSKERLSFLAALIDSYDLTIPARSIIEDTFYIWKAEDAAKMAADVQGVERFKAHGVYKSALKDIYRRADRYRRSLLKDSLLSSRLIRLLAADVKLQKLDPIEVEQVIQLLMISGDRTIPTEVIVARFLLNP